MKQKTKLPKQINRIFSLTEEDRATNIDAESREVTFAVSSEIAINDYYGEPLILDHGDRSVEMERIKTAAPLLFNHNRDLHLGKIVRADLQDRRLMVTAKFGNSELAREKFQDVLDGILTEVSVSVNFLEIPKLDQSMSDGVDTYRALKWEPIEASLVTVPADISVGIGRAESNEADEFLTKPEILNMETENPKQETVERSEVKEARPVIKFKTDPKDIERSQKDERQRVSSIHDLANRYNVESNIVRDYVDNSKPLAEFQNFLLTERMGAKVVKTESSELGMSKKEKEAYSLVRAMNCVANGKTLDGLEGEANEAMSQKLKREAKGFFIPTDVATHSRDLSAGVATKGGYTVGTDVLGSSLVELLRNKALVSGLGVQTLSGLNGNVSIPKAEGGATSYWLDEAESVTNSDQDFGSITLTPKRLAGVTAYSKQLLSQSSISIESFVRDDLMRVLAIAKDLAALAGTGTDGEPLGILNTTGINTVTFGAAATFAKMVEFESTLGTDNADLGALSYLTTPAVRGALKTKDVSTSTGQFVWSNDMVNGYSANATNQMPDNKVIFGNWSDAMFGDWEGMDVVVDPYSLKKKGQIEIVIQLLTDFAVRNPVSFCASTDAGNQ